MRNLENYPPMQLISSHIIFQILSQTSGTLSRNTCYTSRKTAEQTAHAWSQLQSRDIKCLTPGGHTEAIEGSKTIKSVQTAEVLTLLPGFSITREWTTWPGKFLFLDHSSSRCVDGMTTSQPKHSHQVSWRSELWDGGGQRGWCGGGADERWVLSVLRGWSVAGDPHLRLLHLPLVPRLSPLLLWQRREEEAQIDWPCHDKGRGEYFAIFM